MRPQTFTDVPSTRKPLSLRLRLQAGADEPRPNVCEVQKNHPNPAQPCANSSKSCIKRVSPFKQALGTREVDAGLYHTKSSRAAVIAQEFLADGFTIMFGI